MTEIDSILLVSFGGPERLDDVIPFLENVTRGRNIPRERLELVADQYRLTGGKSPINQQCRDLISSLRKELDTRQIDLPIYWGNRNWDPFLTGTFREMARDGRKHAVAFVTAAYSSYSGCRQYSEDIARARAEAARSDASAEIPTVEKIGQYFDEPGFLDPFVDSIKASIHELTTRHEIDFDREIAIAFCAHSLPAAMAANCRYESQLLEAAKAIVGRLGSSTDQRGSPGDSLDSTEAGISPARFPAQWALVYQSRSGRPGSPWLEPDINDHLRSLSRSGISGVVVAPIGFISDHQEVIFDLDVTAANTASELGLKFSRSATPATDPRFISMIADLVSSHLEGIDTSRCLGENCCLPGSESERPATAGRPKA